MAQPDGRVGHAELQIGDSVEDVDAVVSQAVAAGTKLLRPVQDQCYGDRSGTIADPYGHVWAWWRIASPPGSVRRAADVV